MNAPVLEINTARRDTPKKTIVLVINCLQGGGGERSVLTLGQGFYELGYEVHIVRFKPLVEYDLNPNLQYHMIRFKPYKLIPIKRLRYQVFASKVDKYILDTIGQPELILSNLEPVDKIMTYSHLNNIMYIIRNTISLKFNLQHKKDHESTLMRLKNVYSNHPCVCVSQGVEDDLRQTLGSDIVSTTIYNSFDREAIQQMGDAFEVSSIHEQINPNQYLVNVGSFKYQKAHDILLKAYAESSMRYPLVLIGKGKLLDESKALAHRLGIIDKVVFLGFHKNPYPFMKQACGLVLSSRFEGFVRVIPEALALDTPVISTNCPSGPSEMLSIKNLVPVDDIMALAHKMSELMRTPETFSAKFNEQFLPKNIAQQYIDYLQARSSF